MLPSLAGLSLRADAVPTEAIGDQEDDDVVDERGPVTTGRTLQKKLEMHGVAHGRTAGVKRKPEQTGIGSSALVWIFFVFVLCGIVLTLFLTLS